MPYSQTAIEDAVVGWLATATGLHVRLANQPFPPPVDAQRKPVPYGTVLVGDVLGLGGWVGEERELDATQPAGQHLLVTTHLSKGFSVSAQLFTPETSGTMCASARLNRAADALQLVGVRQALRVAGIAPLSVGPVRNLSEIIQSSWRGRAQVEVQFHVVASPSERLSYINQVG